MSGRQHAGWTIAVSDLEEIRFSSCGPEVAFRFLRDAFVPRPVFPVGAVSARACYNVAPFSYVTPCATVPAAVVMSIPQRDDGSDKDTLVNLRAAGEFVINAVTADNVDAANVCAEILPPNVSEFNVTGLTPMLLSSCAPPHARCGEARWRKHRTADGR